MPTHRPARVGAAFAVLGILGLTGPAWGQPAAPSPAQGAFSGFIPLLQREEPHPSFWGEASPPSADGEAAQAQAEAARPAPAAPDERQTAAEGDGDHAHH